MKNSTKFTKLTSADKTFINTYNSSLPPYADWAYGTLLAWWDFYDDLEYMEQDGNLVIRSSYLSEGKESLITLIGKNNVTSVIDKLFKWQLATGQKQILASVPSYVVDSLEDKSKYIISEDLDNAEYVLSVKSHANLAEPEHKRIRQKLHAFERQPFYSTLTAESYPLDSTESKVALINALHAWDVRHQNDRDFSEGLVIDKVLRIADEIDLKCFCITIDGKIASFILYKDLGTDTINLNHLKVNYAYRDIFHFSLHRFAQYLDEIGVKFMNIEQDLGIEGLRTYKQRLRPTHMMRKYTIQPAE